MKVLTEEQTQALHALQSALRQATDSSLLDHLSIFVHPDVVNTFCDAVQALQNEEATP